MIKVLPVRGGAGEVIRVWRWDGGDNTRRWSDCGGHSQTVVRGLRRGSS
jgi:hypothetical protein